jgi:ABC-2 type transport system permease protein
LFTSQYSRSVGAPVNVSIQELRRNVKVEDFSKSFIPVGYLLEGKFTSLYKNRFLPEGTDQQKFKGESVPTKIIVVADGDLARNDINPRTLQPQPLGYDPFTKYTFANQELLMNMLAYLTDENGLIRARNKEVKIRPLNREKIAEEKLNWQILNIIAPLVLLISYGIVRSWTRKKKYANFQ